MLVSRHLMRCARITQAPTALSDCLHRVGCQNTLPFLQCLTRHTSSMGQLRKGVGLVSLNRLSCWHSQSDLPFSLVHCVQHACVVEKEEPRSSSVNLIVAMDVAKSIATVLFAKSLAIWPMLLLTVLGSSCNALQCTMLQRS